MKILKRIGIAILAIFLLIVIIGLFLPSVSHIEETIVVNAPVETVFEQVNTMKNWEKWSPWFKADSTTKLTYNNVPSGNGASYSWVAEKMGEGTLTLSDVKPYEHITENMVFLKPNNDKGTATMDFTKEGNGVKVVWKMDMDWGWNVFARWAGVVFVKNMMSEFFANGLKDIKDVAEHAPVVSESGATYKVEGNIELPARIAIAISGKVAEKDFKAFFDKSYLAIQGVIEKGGAKATNKPAAVYYNYVPGGVTTLDAYIEVDKKIAVPANMKILELKATKAAKVDYYGPYSGSGAAHEAIDKWLKANSKKATGAPWEVYVTDPMVEKDSTKWLTEVLYPIE